MDNQVHEWIPSKNSISGRRCKKGNEFAESESRDSLSGNPGWGTKPTC